MQQLPSYDMIIFGGTGDLSRRKLLPALYYTDRCGQMPEDARILALGRHSMSSDAYREKMRESAEKHISASEFSAEAWDAFAQHLEYMVLDVNDKDGFSRLVDYLDGGEDRVRVFYMATIPDLYCQICDSLAASGLVTPKSRVVLEKPLGRDLKSSQEINRDIGAVFHEDQVYRIDHYLGKETVQNLMALRFGNALFEPLWRREWIRDVQITVAEQIGVEGRADFYDRTGALRDMVQNHLMQLLCILAMEPPINIESDAIRDEKLKVVRSLVPMDSREALGNVVRGQYHSGNIAGQAVRGYLQEEGVAADSRTETFVALKTELTTWRWAGVPFYLRTGKRLQERVSEIVVNFREVPHSLFDSSAGLQQANRLVIRLQPNESLKLFLMAKAPGDAMRLRPVHLDLNFAEVFTTRQLDAYERLLMDVVRGKLGLFMRGDELEAAWGWIEPIQNYWASLPNPPKRYSAGTWGPAASSALISRHGSTWHEED